MVGGGIPTMVGREAYREVYTQGGIYTGIHPGYIHPGRLYHPMYTLWYTYHGRLHHPTYTLVYAPWEATPPYVHPGMHHGRLHHPMYTPVIHSEVRHNEARTIPVLLRFRRECGA